MLSISHPLIRSSDTETSIGAISKFWSTGAAEYCISLCPKMRYAFPRSPRALISYLLISYLLVRSLGVSQAGVPGGSLMAASGYRCPPYSPVTGGSTPSSHHHQAQQPKGGLWRLGGRPRADPGPGRRKVDYVPARHRMIVEVVLVSSQFKLVVVVGRVPAQILTAVAALLRDEPSRKLTPVQLSRGIHGNPLQPVARDRQGRYWIKGFGIRAWRPNVYPAGCRASVSPPPSARSGCRATRRCGSSSSRPRRAQAAPSR